MTCGSNDNERYQVPIDFPEKALLRPAEAAIEYEQCRRDMSRYLARFRKDTDAGRALFGYVRSESRLLERLLGDRAYGELLRLVRRHRRQSRPRPPNQRGKARKRSQQP